MIKDLDMLLTYQELDIKLRRVYDNIERSSESKKMEQAKAEFAAAKKVVDDSEKQAAKLLSVYNCFVGRVKAAAEKVAEIQLIIDNAESEEDLDGIMEQLEEWKNRVNSFEKNINDNKAEAEELLKNYQNANMTGHKIKEYYAKVKQGHSDMVKSVEGEVNELKSKLREIEPQINKTIMSKYKAVTAENKYPALVEVQISDGKSFCGGCGLQLSQKSTSILSEKNMCNCETCRRIIFKR